MTADATVFNHVGICVSDLQRSRRFYEEVLNFRFWWELEPPDQGTDTLLQVSQPVGLHAAYLVRDGLVLELLHYRDAGTTSPATPRVMNELGLTHLSLAADDIPTVLAKVADHGGEVVKDTDIQAAVMIRDPDGQLIELTGLGFRESLPPLPD